MSDNQDALRLAEYWETRAKDLQTWVDENYYVEFGYRPEGLKREQADQQRTAAELRRLHAENEAVKVARDTMGNLWAKEKALNAELVEALRGTFQEMLSVVASLNAEQMPHDGDEFHERLEKARAALAKVEASK